MDNKEFGLVRLFKSLNDPDYNRYAFGCMPKSFDNMGEFFEAYSEVILDHYQVSLVSREMPYKTNQKHKARLKDYYERKRQLSFTNKGGRQLSKFNRLSHIRNEVLDESDEESYDPSDIFYDQVEGIEDSLESSTKYL